MVRKALLLLVVAVALAAVPVAALADQTSNSQSTMHHGTGYSCSGGNVTGTAAGPESGHVVAHLNPDGTVTVNVTILDGDANSAYHLSVGCQFFFGGGSGLTVTTNDQGNAAGHFVIQDPPHQPFAIWAHNTASGDRFVSDLLTTG